jgi:hypothetical protein
MDWKGASSYRYHTKISLNWTQLMTYRFREKYKYYKKSGTNWWARVIFTHGNRYRNWVYVSHVPVQQKFGPTIQIVTARLKVTEKVIPICRGISAYVLAATNNYSMFLSLAWWHVASQTWLDIAPKHVEETILLLVIFCFSLAKKY